MKIKLSLLALVIGGLFFFTGLSIIKADLIDVNKFLPSSEDLLQLMENDAFKNKGPTRLYDNTYVFYVPGKPGVGDWSNPLHTMGYDMRSPFKANLPIREGIVLPLIEAMKSKLTPSQQQEILDPSDPNVDLSRYDSNFNFDPLDGSHEIVRSLKDICDRQCTLPKYYEKFRLCRAKDCDKDGNCECPGNTRSVRSGEQCHNVSGGKDCTTPNVQELIDHCRDFECGVSVDEDDCTDQFDIIGNKKTVCNMKPINSIFYSNDQSTLNKYLQYDWAQDAYRNCVQGAIPLDNFHPQWCEENPPANPDDEAASEVCSTDDRQMQCFIAHRVFPRLAEASLLSLTEWNRIFQLLSASAKNGPLADLINDMKRQIEDLLKDPNNYFYPPINIGGGYQWSQTPEEANSSEVGFCINKTVNTCSCGHILPFNGSTVTVGAIQRKLLGYGVTDAHRYCVNTADNLSCRRSYSWDIEEVKDADGNIIEEHPRNQKVGMRNLYSSRAAFPGWVDHEAKYHHGATCSKRPKGSSIGASESGSKTRNFSPTDKEFFFLQARFFADQAISQGITYGGCDDRSNILFNHATAAHCDRKNKSGIGIKCRAGSRRRFKSFACDASGGVIDQCGGKSSPNGGHNVICQVCGPIYCGENGLYSDTNTVRKNFALKKKNGEQTPTRHYGFLRDRGYYHPKGGTSYGGGVPEGGGTIDGSEEFYSYTTIACQGTGCGVINDTTIYNDAVFTPRSKSEYGQYELAGNVFDDRTCPEGEIVDPCSQILIPNNWGGNRLCYKSCCVSSDNQTCDHYVGKCPAGECCDKNVCHTTAGEYQYGNELCDIGGDKEKKVVGLSIANNAQPSAEQICEAAGRQDAVYTGTVGKGYILPLLGNSQCYFCGCAPIAMKKSIPSSGWWPKNSTISIGEGVNQKCLTPIEYCAHAFNRTGGNGRPVIGFDGLAEARDGATRSPLLKSIENYGIGGTNWQRMTQLTCVRCRCVDGDGICDGCDNDPNGKCKNFIGDDPDCVNGCPTTPPPVDQCGPHNCPGACGACTPRSGYKVTPYPYLGYHSQCVRCVYRPEHEENCNYDHICDPGETCETCPSDCGQCLVPDQNCPDGYSRLCPGVGYPSLSECKRCYDSKKPNVERHGCKNDGYCNPLCDSKDEDCEIHKTTEMTGNNGCPKGYGSSSEDDCKGGDQHFIMSSCFSCGKCDPGGLSCPKEHPNDIDWKLVTLAQQQQIYQGSHCYGYQFFNAKLPNPYIAIGADVSFYDYQQRNAWMSNGDGKNFDQLDAKGGYRRCRPVRKPVGSSSDNCEYRCIPAMHQLIVLSCSEIDARFPHEFGYPPVAANGLNQQIFIPDIARSAGNEVLLGINDRPTTTEGTNYVLPTGDARCGRYYSIYAGESAVEGDLNGDGRHDWRDDNATASYLYTNWWQIGGNVYGQDRVSNYGDQSWQVADPNDANIFTHNPATKHLVKPSFQYALNDSQCLVAPNALVKDGNYTPVVPPSVGAGLQVSGGEVTKIKNLRTYRETHGSRVNSLSAERGYNFSAKLQRVLDYDYYRSLLQKMPGNGSCHPVETGTGSNKETTEVCYYLGEQNYKKLKTKIDHVGGGKRVIFIDGNFTLDDNMPVGGGGDSGYLALIIKGDFIIEPEVGYHLTQNNGQACAIDTSNLCNPAFNAVVVARSLAMKQSSAMMPDSLFNPLITCDKRLVLKGAYAFWGNQPVVFTRSLLGCGFKKGPFPNGKASLNTHDVGRNDGFDGRQAGLNNKNEVDEYCRTGAKSRNGNGYYNYKAGGESAGMYNNYNRLFAATQIIANPQLIEQTPAWMRQNLSTRLEVR